MNKFDEDVYSAHDDANRPAFTVTRGPSLTRNQQKAARKARKAAAKNRQRVSLSSQRCGMSFASAMAMGLLATVGDRS